MKRSLMVITAMAVLSAPAFAIQFKVICAGSGSGADGWNSFVSGLPAAAQTVGTSISDQLAALASKQTILEVSAPSTSGGSAIATNKDYWGDIVNNFACVTVKFQ